ncbi:hypothetical protein [Calothrix sp. NIES-2098]|uniref:hypothetical protein n=1 Tax=Calothrix sp. NIES-2098 TaxID=1954171 RepID=UPI000B61039D|nr:hypothetical protein NIES2098_34580 [Calothrix sp. NIES-2098]
MPKNNDLFLTGTVKDLIKRLQNLDPDAVMSVHILGEGTDCEYDIDEVVINEKSILLVVNDDNLMRDD